MTEAHREGLGARLAIGLQYLLPQHALSRIAYRVTRSGSPRLAPRLISSFVRSYKPRMEDAIEPDPRRYRTFNEFFTRALRADARPVDPDPMTLVSPVDGSVSQIGAIESGTIMQAKGHRFTVETLLAERLIAGASAGATTWARRFAGGSFATLYLAPHNYHRIHMPLAGTLRSAWYVPGRLFSVNTRAAAYVPELFARNERVVCVFENGSIAFALVLVGALFVGSMETVWHGEVTPARERGALLLPPPSIGASLGKGAEMGRFNMGSTVILLLSPGAAEWLAGFHPGTPVAMGRALGRLTLASG